MTIGQANTEALIAPLSLARGGFAMLALDQRESLRAMFARAIWSDVIGEQDVGPALRTRSARRLDQMVAIVEHSMRERVSGGMAGRAREEDDDG